MESIDHEHFVLFVGFGVVIDKVSSSITGAVPSDRICNYREILVVPVVVCRETKRERERETRPSAMAPPIVSLRAAVLHYIHHENSICGRKNGMEL
mmetsp:Transcript_20808/g.48986  ORF Transcript_20808/g.48986 Transcript_20808/m.48986 type:complete len:96 (+) Transcript_20808:157-444(+)